MNSPKSQVQFELSAHPSDIGLNEGIFENECDVRLPKFRSPKPLNNASGMIGGMSSSPRYMLGYASARLNLINLASTSSSMAGNVENMIGLAGNVESMTNMVGNCENVPENDSVIAGSGSATN